LLPKNNYLDMKIRELRSKSPEELKDMFEDMTQKLRELNFKLASEQLKNVREVRDLKKSIAQIKTLINQRSKAKEVKAKQ